MVSPVTGPYNRLIRLRGTQSAGSYFPYKIHDSSSWYRQRKPYTLPLTYGRDFEVLGHYVLGGRYVEAGSSPGIFGLHSSFSTFEDQLYNRVYERFKGKLGEQSENLVNLAERKQAMSMISRRANQLVKFTSSVRKGRFGDAMSALGWTEQTKRKWTGTVVDKRTGRKIRVTRTFSREKIRQLGSKDIASSWLEYHFGWAPLVADIYNSLDLLQRPLPFGKIAASASAKMQFAWRYGPYEPYQDCTVEYKKSIQSEVSVSNPNLWLANQMGLINPITVAWELVPFSFLVDWFVNVGDVLKSFTDFHGLSLVNTQRFNVRQIDSSYRYADAPTMQPFTGRKVTLQRLVGPIPGPTLRIKPFKGLSPSRGLTAISLLVQQLR